METKDKTYQTFVTVHGSGYSSEELNQRNSADPIENLFVIKINVDSIGGGIIVIYQLVLVIVYVIFS